MELIWSDSVGHWEGLTRFVFDVSWRVDGELIASIDFAGVDLPTDMTPMMALDAFLNPVEMAMGD